jgi:hypothetical protein
LHPHLNVPLTTPSSSSSSSSSSSQHMTQLPHHSPPASNSCRGCYSWQLAPLAVAQHTRTLLLLRPWQVHPQQQCQQK